MITACAAVTCNAHVVGPPWYSAMSTHLSDDPTPVAMEPPTQPEVQELQVKEKHHLCTTAVGMIRQHAADTPRNLGCVHRQEWLSKRTYADGFPIDQFLRNKAAR